MARPSSRHKAGYNEIKTKESKIREEVKKRAEAMKKDEITPEEHEERLKKLREIGLIK